MSDRLPMRHFITALWHFVYKRGLAIPLLLLVAVGLNIQAAIEKIPTAVYPDSLNGYLPLAREFLSQPFSFLRDEHSVHVAPMGYMWNALFGANVSAIEVANGLLSCLMIFVLYRLGRRLHSKAAGVVAAYCYVLSPLLADYKIAVLTEPLFLFCTAVWLMAVAEMDSKERWPVWVAGIAFGLGILSRGTYIYFLYAVLAISLVMCFLKAWRHTAQRLFLAHVLALLFPLVFIVKNWIFFDYPNIATGVGAALYLGNHPVTQGYEAPYFQLSFDDGAVTQGLSHLSIAGDALLKGTALFMLKQQAIGDVLTAYVQKTIAFLFVTKAVLFEPIWNWRSFRIAEIVLAVIGLFAVRQVWMRYFLAGAVTYQVAVHAPVLYTVRYSIGVLEIPLIILSAVGFVQLCMQLRNGRRVYARFLMVPVLLLIVGGVALGERLRTSGQVFMPDVLSGPHQSFFAWDATAAQTGKIVTTPHKTWAYEIPIPQLPLNGKQEDYVASINITATPSDAFSKCSDVGLYWKTVADPQYTELKSSHFNLVTDGKAHWYHLSLSLSQSNVYPADSGAYQLLGNCASVTHIEVNSFKISASRVGQVFRAQYLKSLER